MQPDGRFDGPDRLSATTIERLQHLAVLVTRRDGEDPLDEAEHLALAAGSTSSAVHLLLDDDDGQLVGYLQLSAPDPRSGDRSAALVVGESTSLDAASVAARLTGIATQRSRPAALTVWSRTDTSPVGTAARAAGFTAERGLLTMARPLTEPADVPPLPAGVELRAFVPGRDDAAWLAVNAAAFATHPEQGAWTPVDLTEREQQDWFDPAGFLLLTDPDDHLLGFHWTKHQAGETDGEVYVLGTAPAAQGRGLGTVLLAAGLRHLFDVGARRAVLYVDEDNAAAVRLYERDGFTTFRRQVQYRSPALQDVAAV